MKRNQTNYNINYILLILYIQIFNFNFRDLIIFTFEKLPVYTNSQKAQMS